MLTRADADAPELSVRCGALSPTPRGRLLWPHRLTAADTLLAVEFVSPGSRNVDLHLKPVEYADAGIPHYWVVDLAPPVPTITVFGLGAHGDGSVESRTAAHELGVTEPFPMRIDIDALGEPPPPLIRRVPGCRTCR